MKLEVLALGLLALLVLSSCNLAVPPDPNDTCSGLKGAARDNCYSESLRCSKISNEKVRDPCVAELAKIKKDPAVCRLIQDDLSNGYCLMQVAKLLGDQ